MTNPTTEPQVGEAATAKATKLFHDELVKIDLQAADTPAVYKSAFARFIQQVSDAAKEAIDQLPPRAAGRSWECLQSLILPEPVEPLADACRTIGIGRQLSKELGEELAKRGFQIVEARPMTAPLRHPLVSERAAEPTLEQRLRYIDLCLECAAEAKRVLPAPMNGWLGDDESLPPSNPSFGPAYRYLRIKRMREEGLPLSLIGDERTAAQRHADKMTELFGAEWDRTKINLTPVGMP